MSYLPYAVAAWLFLVGLYGVVSSRNLIHMALCLTVMQSSTYVLLLAIVVLAPGLSDARALLRHAAAPWLVLAVVLEALSCWSYVAGFRPVFCQRMSWRTARPTMAGCSAAHAVARSRRASTARRGLAPVPLPCPRKRRHLRSPAGHMTFATRRCRPGSTGATMSAP